MNLYYSGMFHTHLQMPQKISVVQLQICDEQNIFFSKACNYNQNDMTILAFPSSSGWY